MATLNGGMLWRKVWNTSHHLSQLLKMHERG